MKHYIEIGGKSPEKNYIRFAENKIIPPVSLDFPYLYLIVCEIL